MAARKRAKKNGPKRQKRTPTPEQKAVGDRMKARRAEFSAAGEKLSAERVARKAGISANHYATLERAEHDPEERTLRRIARALQCTPEYLLTGEPAPAKPVVKNGGES
jgi:transcriptional regulator with XRE-family HTH domain